MTHQFLYCDSLRFVRGLRWKNPAVENAQWALGVSCHCFFFIFFTEVRSEYPAFITAF